tara:strand:- start:320 stop:505 length:186 start_codon:yes stop_codon:yes gene_type:complete
MKKHTAAMAAEFALRKSVISQSPIRAKKPEAQAEYNILPAIVGIIFALALAASPIIFMIFN